MTRRRCSRSACSGVAIATLTYAYADSTAVLGPLAPFVEPHTYDLCAVHAERLTVPRGWEVLRLPLAEHEPTPSGDDLLALANAVREAALPPRRSEPPDGAGGGSTRGHLRALPTPT